MSLLEKTEHSQPFPESLLIPTDISQHVQRIKEDCYSSGCEYWAKFHYVHSSCRKLHLDFVQVLNLLYACCNITPLWDDLFAELNWNLKQYWWCSSAPRFVFKAPKLKTAVNLSSTASITAREVSEMLFNASGFNLKGNTFRVNALMDSEAETGQLRWKAATW